MRTSRLEEIDSHFLAFAWANLSPKDRARILAGTPRTVWIFGAGASHHYNLNARGVPLPLANGFIQALHVLPTSEGFHSRVGPLISFLSEYKGIRPDKASDWSENIEEFMTDVEQELNRIRSMEWRSEDEVSRGISCAELFNNMAFILANVINEAQNGPSVSLYSRLLDFCSPGDTFITFNWDTLLDRALVDSGCWSPNDGYGLTFSAVMDGTWKSAVEGELSRLTKWKLLKLHGSVNWLIPYTSVNPHTLEVVSVVPGSSLICLYWQSSLRYHTHRGRWRGGYGHTCYGYYPPNLPANLFSENELSAGPGRVFIRILPMSYSSPFAEESEGGVPSSPLLITPVRQKRYEYYEASVGSLWDQAAESVKSADRVVIVGYSFPRTDTKILDLLSASLSSTVGTVEVVAPDSDEIVARISAHKDLQRVRLVSRPMTFEAYVEMLTSEAPKLLRELANKHIELKEWIQKIEWMSQLSRSNSSD